MAYNNNLEQLAASNQKTQAIIDANHGMDGNAAMEAAASQADNMAASAPEVQPLDFGQMLRDRQAKEYEAERDKEAKRIERERLGHSIAGAAAIIGDMIRASEGAPVLPRDYQQMYDNLTAQERANTNNYQIRMAKLQEDARQERLMAAQQAAAAQKAAQEQAVKLAIEQAKLRQSGENAKLQADATRYRADKGADATRYAADKRAENKNGDPLKGTVPLTFGGENYYMRNTETFKQACRKINGMLSSLNIPIDLKTQIGIASSRTDEAVNGVTNALEQLEIVTGTPDRQKKQVTQQEYDKIKTYLNSIKVNAGSDEDDGWEGYDD